ncbi:MAG: radical SAM protein [Clostridiales bacterium]|jgi:MoaA/NifB/PqqE/SkfB family radical SAM enzyme|nr:radical SAM protein [Clostridiales bacterium]
MPLKATPYSNIKIFAHPDKIDSMKNGDRTAPLFLRIKPTNMCNHRCYYCSYADDVLGLRDRVAKNDQIPWGKMREILDDMASMGVKAVIFSGGGEPLVYPKIVSALRKARDSGIDFAMITNGQLLNGERAEALSNAKWVRVSFDSADAETYAMTRGVSPASWGQVCENIKNFSRLKAPSCELGVNFVITHDNASQAYEAAKLVKSLGANHIKFAARVTKDLHEYHKPFKENAFELIHMAISDFADDSFRVVNKYEEDFEHDAVPVRPYSKCFIKDISAVIGADSKVYFCHDKAYVSNGVVGDLKERGFKELWFSDELTERFNNFDPVAECRHHCVYDDRNILLNTFFSLNHNHINFV